MKRFFILLLISLFTGINAQETKNRFEESEKGGFERNIDHTNDQSSDNPQAGPGDGGPGNPGETAPIDDYLPLLLITALGLIVYQVHKQKQVN